MDDGVGGSPPAAATQEELKAADPKEAQQAEGPVLTAKQQRKAKNGRKKRRIGNRVPTVELEEIKVPEGCPLSLEELQTAARVGQWLSTGLERYDCEELKQLRKAWGPLMAHKAKFLFVTGPKEDKKARERKQKAHDKKVLETRRLRQARRQQLQALQDNPLSSMAAIPDGVADDGFNTSFGVAGGTESVPQVLRAPKALADGSACLEEEEDEPELYNPRSCYACKARYFKMHHFYDQMCPECAVLNWNKRMQTTDMRGKVVFLTGGRVKIGYHIGLKCLRMGATLHVTSRFVADAALRYSKEKDFNVWKDNLKIHGVDFRDIAAVENFAMHLADTLPRLDVIINNACQTIRRPPAYYRHLLDMEEKLLVGDAANGSHFTDARATIDTRIWHGAKTKETKAVQDVAANAPKLGIDLIDPKTVDSANRTLSAAAMTQVSLGGEDVEDASNNSALFPKQMDVNGTQIDLRTRNSWLLKLSDVSTPEVIEVMAVNSVAPLVFNAKLKPLMLKTRAIDTAAGLPDAGCYVINVSAMEGKFYRHKNSNHPHTNMAKAALNMMTRTSGADYAADGIYMNSVDTGWINDENPIEKAAKISVTNNFQTPIDEVDAASRVLDPAVSGMNGEPKVFGKFLKDYRETEW